MLRLQILITAKQRLLLDKNKKEGRSTSAFIREILDEYFKSRDVKK